MKEAKFTLPIKYKGDQVAVGLTRWNPYVFFRDQKIYFVLDKKILIGILVVLSVICYQIITKNDAVQVSHNHYYDGVITTAPNDIRTPNKEFEIKEDEFEIPFEFSSNFELTNNSGSQALRQAFLREKHKITYKYIMGNNVARADLLDDYTLIEMNTKISKLFISMILDNLTVEEHVYKFFTDSADLKKIETSLMEQAKFNIPASIKLSQSALETSYGRRIMNNNYFGIKDKTGNTKRKTTTEYYTEKELRRNKDKVVSKKLVKKNGKMFYKCKVKDHFEEYTTPWQSFRAHSNYLRNNNRYHKLFSRGKKYDEWADTIGSTKMGGVGYATSPIYGNILKSIIKRYHLDLLDF